MYLDTLPYGQVGLQRQPVTSIALQWFEIVEKLPCRRILLFHPSNSKCPMRGISSITSIGSVIYDTTRLLNVTGYFLLRSWPGSRSDKMSDLFIIPPLWYVISWARRSYTSKSPLTFLCLHYCSRFIAIASWHPTERRAKMMLIPANMWDGMLQGSRKYHPTKQRTSKLWQIRSTKCKRNSSITTDTCIAVCFPVTRESISISKSCLDFLTYHLSTKRSPSRWREWPRKSMQGKEVASAVPGSTKVLTDGI